MILMLRSLLLSWPLVAVLAAVTVAPAAQPVASDVAFYEQTVKPILAGACFECHSHEAKKFKGGLALDKSTGAIAWKSKDNNAGYSTPLPVRRGADWLALLSNESAYLAVELGTGKPVWRVRWLTEYGVNAADPVLAGNQIFISSGYGKGGALLRLGTGEPEVMWRSKVLRTQMNPAIFLGGFFYGVDGDTTDKGVLKCIEAATGKERWERKNFGSGALTAADDKLIALSERGELFVAPATPDAFKPIAQAQVIGGKNWTGPVLANGRIHCRNARGDVVCLDVGKK